MPKNKLTDNCFLEVKKFDIGITCFSFELILFNTIRQEFRMR